MGVDITSKAGTSFNLTQESIVCVQTNVSKQENYSVITF